MKRLFFQIVSQSMFAFMSWAWLQSVPVDVEGSVFEEGACSSSFVAHSLDHITSVPGGNQVRMFEANGGGVAINDLDNDGDLDIVLANHAAPNTILWNEGQLNFRTERIGTGDSRAVTLIDLDADGWQDIIFSRRVSAPNYWHNQGDGRFELKVLPNVTKPLYAITWADLDADGDLDLVGGSYDAALLTEFGNDFLQSGNAGVYVYLNEQGQNEQGRFVETRLSTNAQALALVVFDLNQDARPDILIGNDFAVPDRAWLNQKDHWQETRAFKSISHSTMSFDSGDINNDGYPELFSTDMKPYPGEDTQAWKRLMESMMSDPHPQGDPQIMENTLQEVKTSSFSNSAVERGVDATGWSWSGKFADFNQDGFLDLYVVNGMIEASIFAHLENQELVEQNQAFKNDGLGNFVSAPEWNLAAIQSGRGMSIADLDGDGDQDIVVNNLRAPALLFENQLCTGKSLQVDLLWEKTKNRQAIGSSLILHTDKATYYRDIVAASGYLSGNTARVHFGIPETETVRFLEVLWPDGLSSRLEDVVPNSLLTIRRQGF
jgi:hypothetical protein